jgi:hypothetical protein
MATAGNNAFLQIVSSQEQNSFIDVRGAGLEALTYSGFRDEDLNVTAIGDASILFKTGPIDNGITRMEIAQDGDVTIEGNLIVNGTITNAGAPSQYAITYNGPASGTGPFYCLNCFNSTYTNYSVTILANSNVSIAITSNVNPTTISPVFTYTTTLIEDNVVPVVTNQGIAAVPIPIGGQSGGQNIITCTLYYPYNPTYAFVVQSSNSTSNGDGIRITNGHAYYSGFFGDTLYIELEGYIGTAPTVVVRGFN